MKQLPWLALALIALSQPAHACKPAEVPRCEAKASIPLHSASFEELSGKVAAFQKELSALILKAPPVNGRSSCFNSHFAEFYIKQARNHAPGEGGKICPALIRRIKEVTEALVNADSEEWKAVKEKSGQATLSSLSKEVRSALEGFLQHH